MKKFALITLLASIAATPVLADDHAKAATTTPAAPTATTTATAVKVETKGAELKDGTKIEITGEKVEVLGKDGVKSPAPDGVHTLKDGSKVETKGGMIVKK